MGCGFGVGRGGCFKRAMDLKNLDDKNLLKATAVIAQKERQITVELLRHLREVERRQLYLEIGYSSLYEFTLKELKLSEGSAYRRIQAMRLMIDVPSAAKQMEEGSLSVTTAARVQSALRKAPPDDKEKVLHSVAGKASRELDRELAKHDPRGPREYTRWLNDQEVQLTFSLAKPDFQQLEVLQTLRMHKDVQKTYRVLVTDLVKLGHEKWNPLQRDATSPVKSHRSNPNQVWKTIPPTLRREIWARDQGMCTYKVPGTTKICGSRELVQLDHIQPLALGGKNEASNLRLLCAAHNRARAKETFGDVT